tara:strand:+ start:1511 stop:2494 length:984 start_codon:yes stop_codon:yes gene_type:complete
MGINLDQLKNCVATYGCVARIVIGEAKGSVPRDIGTSMMVWARGQIGTIGGGALEFQAVNAARRALRTSKSWISPHPLGPQLGQCCGGFVKLVTEIYTVDNLPLVQSGLLVRLIGEGNVDQLPLKVSHAISSARNQGLLVEPQLIDNWMVEPVINPGRDLWIWGAGHVGRALVETFQNLPDLRITWIDTSQKRFPKYVPEDVDMLVSKIPADLVKYAESDVQHLVLTYSHAIDFELCHALLLHKFRWAGLIGSKTKWERFCRRLKELGHHDAQIKRITCPIGRPEFGKHPHQIAIGVATEYLSRERVIAKSRSTQHGQQFAKCDGAY